LIRAFSTGSITGPAAHTSSLDGLVRPLGLIRALSTLLVRTTCWKG